MTPIWLEWRGKSRHVGVTDYREQNWEVASHITMMEVGGGLNLCGRNDFKTECVVLTEQVALLKQSKGLGTEPFSVTHKCFFRFLDPHSNQFFD